MSAQAALNAPRHRFMNWVAQKGQDGDNEIGHLSTGDAIVPVEKTRGNPRLQALLHQVYQEAKIDPRRFVVGHPQNRRNQKTGLREFGDPGGDNSGGGGNPGDAGGGGSDSGGQGGSTSGSGPGGESPGAAAAALSSEATAAGTLSSDPSLGFQEAAPTPAPPSFLDRAVNQIPGMLASLAVGAIPGIGPALSIGSAISGLSGELGGPTVGTIGSLSTDALSALGAAGNNSPASTGSGGSLGSGGSANDVPVDQQAADAEWLRRLNLG